MSDSEKLQLAHQILTEAMQQASRILSQIKPAVNDNNRYKQLAIKANLKKVKI